MNTNKLKIIIIILLLPIFFTGCASSPDTAGKAGK